MRVSEMERKRSEVRRVILICLLHNLQSAFLTIYSRHHNSTSLLHHGSEAETHKGTLWTKHLQKVANELPGLFLPLLDEVNALLLHLLHKLLTLLLHVTHLLLHFVNSLLQVILLLLESVESHTCA